jgi:hypothetical protein
LAKLKDGLGLKFFRKPESKAYHLLIDWKIIKAGGMLVDARGFSEGILNTRTTPAFSTTFGIGWSSGPGRVLGKETPR